MASKSEGAGLLVGAMTWGPPGTDVTPTLASSVKDHYERARYFLGLAQVRGVDYEKYTSWNVMASVYGASASLDIAFEYASGTLRMDRAALIDAAKQQVRFFQLIGDLRVHDFHRQAVRFRSGVNATYGPITMKTSAQSGSQASMVMDDPETGQVVQNTTRNARIQANRFLTIQSFNVRDPASNAYVNISDALGNYLDDVYPFLERNLPRHAMDPSSSGGPSKAPFGAPAHSPSPLDEPPTV